MIKDRRIGKFMVSMELINRSPESVAEMLKLLEFVPLKVEMRPWEAKYKYVGISPLFEPIDEGGLPLFYKIEHDILKKTVTAKRFIYNDKVT